MKFRKVIAVIMVSVMAFGVTSCKARERYLREQELTQPSSALHCSFDYGRFDLPPGWVETAPGSYELTTDNDDYYSYYFTVTYETNDYTGDDRYMFAEDNDEPIHQEFPDDEVYTLSSGGVGDDASATYMIEAGDTYIIRWYRVRAGDQVMFELTTPDAGVQDREVYWDIEFSVTGFVWNDMEAAS